MADFTIKENNSLNDSISNITSTTTPNSYNSSASTNILAAIIPILILCAISTVVGFVSFTISNR